VHGFEEVLSKVGNMPSAYPFVTSQDTWLVENTGAGGLGAVAQRPQGLWTAVGALIAYRTPEAGIWNLAVIRHLTDESADRFLGIELLSQGGTAVALHPIDARRGNEDECLGVWLVDEASTNSGRIRLLVPRGVYQPTHPLRMTLHERAYRLSPQMLMTEGPDYQVAVYGAVSDA
jgi:hypothetical protein